MRKKDYVVKLNYKDEKFSFVAKNCQHLSQNQILSIVSKNRLQSYIHQGIVKKLHYICNSKQSTAYELTHKGREWIRQNYPQFGSDFYISTTAIRHNIRLAEQVLEHYSQDGYTWLNERNLRSILMERIERAEETERLAILSKLENNELSVPDGGYYVDGQLVCIEVYNDNYTSEILAAKQECASVLGGSLKLVHQ